MKLIIEDDEGKTTVYPLSDREITLGRNEGNTIRLMERNVSRRHARFFELGGRLVLEDLDSYNGIQLNGERVLGRAEVVAGDRVQIGDYQIALEAEDEAEEDTFDVPLPEPAPTPALYPSGSEDATHPTPALDPTSAHAVTDEPAPSRAVAVRWPEPRLICVSTEFAGSSYPLRGDDVVGRIDESDIVIEHPSVSRRHARVVSRGDDFEIRDLGSANGVLVNGEPIESRLLRAHDVVELGHVLLRFIPGHVPFAPNDDELDALQAAGYELAAEADPSHAVTVTDEPAFPPPEPTPRLFEPTATHRARSEPDASTARLPRLDFAPRAPVSSSGRSWRAIAAVSVLVLAGLGAAAFASFSASRKESRAWDEALRVEFDQGRFEEVMRIYESHEGRFLDEAAAGRIMGAAQERYVQGILRQAHEAIERSDHDLAIELLERCLERAPRMTACHWSIGVAYARSDRAELAARHYRRFVELAPDDERVPSVLEVLESYESSQPTEEVEP